MPSDYEFKDFISKTVSDYFHNLQNVEMWKNSPETLALVLASRPRITLSCHDKYMASGQQLSENISGTYNEPSGSSNPLRGAVTSHMQMALTRVASCSGS